jgi:transposase
MNEIIHLTGRQRSILEYLPRTQCDSRQYQRALALLLLDEGDTPEEVAEYLHVSRQTVYNWARRFEQRQALAPALRLLDAPRSGRPPTAQGIIDPLIEAVIDEDPRDYGYNSTVWTAALLRLYLWQEHRRAAGRRSIGRAMARLRLRWKHPRHELARRAPFWRQAKGGSKRASGRIPARSL